MLKYVVAAEITAKSLFDASTLTTVQQSFADMQFTGAQVIGMGVVAAVAIAGLSGAAWMVVKWVKGALSKAS